MKWLFVLPVIVIFQSQAMTRDPRVYAQMEQMGMNDGYIGMSNPQIQPDGKKIYFAKGYVYGAESLVMARYNADDTLDTSFGQNGVASEPVPSKLFIQEAVDMHLTGQRPKG